jgi:oxygen-independent coproporphyrinogen-3 oxidase
MSYPSSRIPSAALETRQLNSAAVAMPAQRRPEIPTSAAPIALQARLLGLRVPPAYFPSADRFQPGFSSAHLRRALWMRSAGRSHLVGTDPLALDIQIPSHCGSALAVTTGDSDAAEPQVFALAMDAYLDALESELALHAQMLPPGQGVSSLSLGGDGLKQLSDGQLQTLVQLVRRHFRLVARAEMVLRFDVCDLPAERAPVFQRLGFNKVVRAVVDSDPLVQYASGQSQDFEMLASWAQAARDTGIQHIQFDIAHGLPLQTGDSLRRTLDQLLLMQPHSVRLLGHSTEKMMLTRRCDSGVANYLPSLQERTAMWSAALALLVTKGWTHLGGEHFTVARSDLDIARRSGRLEHDFHGYTAMPAADVIGVGLGAISRVGVAYARNTVQLSNYQAALARGEFPVFSGLVLDQDSLARRAVIHDLVCEGRLDFDRIAALQRLDFRAYFAEELQSLAVMARFGLVRLTDQSLELTAVGKYFLGSVVAVFHPASQASLRALTNATLADDCVGSDGKEQPLDVDVPADV